MAGMEAREAAARALIGRTVLVTPDLTVAGHRQRYMLLVENADVIDQSRGTLMLRGQKLRLDGVPPRRKHRTKIEILASGWEQALGVSAEGDPKGE